MHVGVLLKREFLIFFRNIHINLLTYFLFPIFSYLFIVAPFSNIFNLIQSSGMNYSYHSIPSLIFVCTSILAFVNPIIIINRDRKEIDSSFAIIFLITNLSFIFKSNPKTKFSVIEIRPIKINANHGNIYTPHSLLVPKNIKHSVIPPDNTNDIL